MRGWHKVAVALGALGLASVIVPRYCWFRRRAFAEGGRFRPLVSQGFDDLAMTRFQRGHKRLVVLAHGFLMSMSDHQMVRLAEAMGERYDVLAFDFAGHGRSGGKSDASFAKAAQDLLRVLDHARTLGYERVGLVGYSMGAAAAILATAQGAPVDAVVSVSCPGVPPRASGMQRRYPTWPWRWWARLVGTRLAPTLHTGPWPVAQVDDVSPVPLLIVHHQFDMLVSREASETLFAVARPPKDYLFVPGALHAMPMSSAVRVMDWLDRKMPLSPSPVQR